MAVQVNRTDGKTLPFHKNATTHPDRFAFQSDDKTLHYYMVLWRLASARQETGYKACVEIHYHCHYHYRCRLQKLAISTRIRPAWIFVNRPFSSLDSAPFRKELPFPLISRWNLSSLRTTCEVEKSNHPLFSRRLSLNGIFPKFKRALSHQFQVVKF